MTSDEMERILEKGIRAPSADNLQPWRFLVRDEQRVDLYLDPNLMGHFSDTAWAAPYFSCGAVIENIRVAAVQLGFDLAVDFLPDAEHPAKAASLSFTSSSLSKSSFFEAIEKRCTNRKFYQKGIRVPRNILDGLVRAGEASSEFKVTILERDAPGYSDLARVIGNADQLRFEIKRLHVEFMSLLRFEIGSADGLDVDSLEAGPGSKWCFRLMRKWERMEHLNRYGLSRLFNAYAKRQILSSSGCCIVTAPKTGDLPVLYMKAGETVQKIWHMATLSGVAVQPMEALPIFLLALDYDCNYRATINHHQAVTLRGYEQEMRRIFNVNGDEEILFFFRFGYASSPKHYSKRRPLKAFMMENCQHAAF